MCHYKYMSDFELFQVFFPPFVFFLYGQIYGINLYNYNIFTLWYVFYKIS